MLILHFILACGSHDFKSVQPLKKIKTEPVDILQNELGIDLFKDDVYAITKHGLKHEIIDSSEEVDIKEHSITNSTSEEENITVKDKIIFGEPIYLLNSYKEENDIDYETDFNITKEEFIQPEESIFCIRSCQDFIIYESSTDEIFPESVKASVSFLSGYFYKYFESRIILSSESYKALKKIKLRDTKFFLDEVKSLNDVCSQIFESLNVFLKHDTNYFMTPTEDGDLFDLTNVLSTNCQNILKIKQTNGVFVFEKGIYERIKNSTQIFILGLGERIKGQLLIELSRYSNSILRYSNYQSIFKIFLKEIRSVNKQSKHNLRNIDSVLLLILFGKRKTKDNSFVSICEKERANFMLKIIILLKTLRVQNFDPVHLGMLNHIVEHLTTKILKLSPSETFKGFCEVIYNQIKHNTASSNVFDNTITEKNILFIIFLLGSSSDYLGQFVKTCNDILLKKESLKSLSNQIEYILFRKTFDMINNIPFFFLRSIKFVY
ncbi:hypothetical protein NGRA_1503 [Nosema granulosis]|uniref:Uncharacterized protein n=1 Tax=Nosema granulosis TaxID=83296 RepID=A0A9P6GYE8_9MICR|nr:hypothetical protein NGRA_1503 [Nosema granulosis]